MTVAFAARGNLVWESRENPRKGAQGWKGIFFKKMKKEQTAAWSRPLCCAAVDEQTSWNVHNIKITGDSSSYFFQKAKEEKKKDIFLKIRLRIRIQMSREFQTGIFPFDKWCELCVCVCVSKVGKDRIILATFGGLLRDPLAALTCISRRGFCSSLSLSIRCTIKVLLKVGI